MAARLTALLPRFLALTVIWLLGAATYTLAADTVPIAKHETKAEAAAKPHVLTVPDVRKKAYVFAKGILQDAGFAWRVDGNVKGFSANTVTVQRPAPGTKVIDNGAPLVVLSLSRNTTYGESGLPENSAPYKATRVVLVSDWARDQIEPTTSGETETMSTETGATTTAPVATTTEPAATTTEPEQPDEKTR
jgi:beta-lactam-binding protein with PASTA domain